MVTTTAQRALRALTVWASLPQGVGALTRELARVTGSPARYLAKVTGALAHAGMVKGKGGAGGGYRLARPAQSVSLGELLAALDGGSTLDACLLAGFRSCWKENGYPAHQQYRHVRLAWQECLKTTTRVTFACGCSARFEGCQLVWREEGVDAAR